MKCLEEDIHLNKLIDRLEVKERLLRSLPSEDTMRGFELEHRNNLTADIFNLRLDIEEWWVKLLKEG